jgi:single-strand DNA-binding protein
MLKLQIVGNLGRDGVLREVHGKSVINFSVAHTERYRDSVGDQKERTIWVDCSYWTDRTGITPHLIKGSLAYAEGIPTAESFTSKNGKQGVALRLRVTDVQLIRGKPKCDGSVGSTGDDDEMISEWL